MRAFHKRFASYGLRRDAIKPGYGLAESTLIVTFTPISSEPKSVRIGRQDSDVLGPVTVHRGTSLFDLHATGGTDDDIEVVSAGVPAEGLCIDLVDAEGRTVDG